MKLEMHNAWSVAALLLVGSSFQLAASQGPSPSPTSSRQACGDSDDACEDVGNATDILGDSCASYHRNWCGVYDDSDFSSSDMCCVCQASDDDDNDDDENGAPECGDWIDSLGGAANCAGTLDGVVGASVTGSTEGFGSVIGNSAHDVFYIFTADTEAVECAGAGRLEFDSRGSSFGTWL